MASEMPERIWAGVYGAGTHDEYGEWDTDANETCTTEYVSATTHQRTVEALVFDVERLAKERDEAREEVAILEAGKIQFRNRVNLLLNEANTQQARAEAAEAAIAKRDEASALAEQATYKALALEYRAEAAEADLSAAREEVERLRDKVDGLSADLDAAVMVAFKYGAKDWARLNYPKHYATLTKEPTDV